jgi:hypothetical protein
MKINTSSTVLIYSSIPLDFHILPKKPFALCKQKPKKKLKLKTKLYFSFYFLLRLIIKIKYTFLMRFKL